MNKTLGALILIFFSQVVFSQVKVQVFDGSESSKPEKSETKKNYTLDDRNLISFNTYLLGRGIFAVSYERVLSPMHSLSFTGGLTYRDLIFELSHTDELNTGNNNNNYGVTKNSTKSSSGYMFDLSYKFYPKSYDDFEGFYISPGILYKHYGYKDIFSQSELIGNSYGYNNSYTNGKQNDVEQPVTYDLTEFSLKFGYMYESWWYDDLIIDFYCGFGLRNAKVTSYQVEKIPDLASLQYDGYSNYYSYNLTPQTTNLSFPCVYLGAKVGIPF